LIPTLDPDAVPRHERALPRLVVHAEREHPLEPLDEPLAPPLLVPVHEHLGVAVGLERVPELLQLVLELRVVVNLTIERHVDRVVLVRHRLVPRRDVDDRQPRVPEPAMPVRRVPVPLPVRASETERVHHAFGDGLGQLPAGGRFGFQQADDAAHAQIPFTSERTRR
jgi:hypothetical protein